MKKDLPAVMGRSFLCELIELSADTKFKKKGLVKLLL